MENEHNSGSASEQGDFDAFATYARATGIAEHHIAIGRAVIKSILNDGSELLSTPTGPWLHLQGGEWMRVDKRWLAMRIEQACLNLGLASNSKLIKETRAWILRQPELWLNRAPVLGVGS